MRLFVNLVHFDVVEIASTETNVQMCFALWTVDVYVTHLIFPRTLAHARVTARLLFLSER